MEQQAVKEKSGNEFEEEIKMLLEVFSDTNISVEDLPDLTDEVVEGIYSYAFGYYEKGWYLEAEPLFRILTALRIRSVKYWKGLGATFQMLKKYPEAIESYGWAAMNDKTMSDPYPHFHAAECLLTHGEVTRALQALNSAKAIARKQGNYHGLLEQIDLLQKTWRGKGKVEN
ncbi:MAG: SycD/LcrH family type III secretion system chaperone [Chlamydiota bacterium]|nr:SycD/LcrH family type III secretion system chaperone [Chlamydiota bacterium]